MLSPGDDVPRFRVTTVEGREVSYSSVWQRKNLVLVGLPAAASADDDDRYVSSMNALSDDFRALNAECVITRDAVDGLEPPAVVVADEWGEIVHASSSPDVTHLLPPAEVLAWLQYLENRCPECEGEAR